jgi:hypothetical protein
MMVQFYMVRRPRQRDQTLLCNGAEGDRTLNLRIANAALSQLSYRPIWITVFKLPSMRDQRKVR